MTASLIYKTNLSLRSKNRESQNISDAYEGMSRIKSTICGRKVLIVLDDVDEISQVDMLMGNQSWFGAQSRIIITTRDTDVLCAVERACQIEGLYDVCTSYKPEYMGDCDSLQLFSKYAFMRDTPMEGYEHFSEEVVSIAAGLPLVLVVLGSTFFPVKGKDLWKEKLRRLRETPRKEILEKLKFSFEALEYEQQQIFLDIACLFIGSDVTLPSYMWDDCGFYPTEGVNVLASRSLITIGDDNKIIMHDQLRDLGRQIVREECLNDLGKRSRLWREEEAMQILETSQGTNSVNTLCLPFRQCEGPVLASSFHDLPNLRYLRMNRQDLDGDFKHCLSNLRWLEWKCSGKFAPSNLHLKNLVILNLSGSRFAKGWEDWSQLKMGKKLKLLDLSDCRDISVLPRLSTFASLEILKLWHCTSLCRLDGLEQLKSLKYLNAGWCKNLETLPSLSNLTNLVELNLGGCEKLVEIPGLEKLESLQVLDLTHCSSLEKLPDFSNLKKLKKFIINSCFDLIEIEGLHGLNSLEHLELSCCFSLNGVPGLSNLHNLKLLHAPWLEIPDFSNLKKLKELMISFSDNLIEYQCLSGSDSSEDLSIFGGSIKRLPELSCLKKLKKLDILFCKHLIEIEDLGGLESLKELQLLDCSSIERLPNLSNLRKLEKFSCTNCENLIGIQGLDRLESLKLFQILNCPSLETLPDLPNFGMLKQIHLFHCDKLHEVEGLGVIESLERLDIRSCHKLREVPDLRSLKNIKTLANSLLSRDS